MPTINVLPDDLINKIAAGEVVERPASVVKELLDNAFDAKSTVVTIDIEEGGTKKIHVTDNGIGMDKEDAVLAFKPHATSKIHSADDLLSISKYGFRGEALASIASVSKVTLKTRRSTDPLGTKIVIEGGNIISIEETGAPIGTSILIEDLFYNVPARKEFLKQAQTEYRAILDIINAHVMANSHIGLNFTNNGKTVYSFPKDDQLEDRAHEVLGKDTLSSMVGIFFEHPHIELYGFVGKPQIATDKPKNQYLFVNKRRIFDRTVSAAVKEAFETLLPKNLYPQYVIFMDVQPNIVDVNVHPRKEEVRFSNSSLIYTSIREAVKKALARHNLTPGSVDGNLQQPPIPKSPFAPNPLGRPDFPGSDPFAAPQSPFTRPTPLGGSPNQSPFGQNPFGGYKRDPMPNPFAKPIGAGSPASPSPIKPQSPNLFADAPWKSNPNDIDDDFEDDFDQPINRSKQSSAPVNFLIVNKLYILKEGANGIILYDQHAVHERINYEKLLKIYKEGKAEGSTQRLLTPIILNLSAKDFSILSENIEELKKMGFDIEEFGGNTYKISEVPESFSKMDLKSLIMEFIVDLESDSKIKDVDNENHKALTYLACRSSYKANDSITPQEIQALLDQLENSEIKYTCPHGRPVKIEIPYTDLDKMFKRTGF